MKPNWVSLLWNVLDRATTVLVIVVSVTFLWMMLASSRLPGSAAPAGQRPPVENIEGAGYVLDIGDAPTQGDPEADVVIVEFSDFQCPYCGTHARDVYPLIERAYIAQGRAKYVFQNLPLEHLHPQALGAAAAAECAFQQKRYWQMHERLFYHQTALSEPDLREHARSLGLDIALFSTCLSAGATTMKVRGDMENADRLGATGTPTFFVGREQPGGSVNLLRRLNGTQTYESFQRVLDDVLAEG